MATRNVKIKLEGGPCNGDTVTRPSGVAFDGYTIVCKGTDYTVKVLPDGALIATAPATAASGGTSTSQTVSDLAAHAAKTLSGWSDLRQSFNKRLPHALKRVEAVDSQVLAAIGRKARGG